MQSDFRIGEWLVQPSVHLIRGPSGQTRVRPKSMAVLLRLANARGEVVSKEALFADIWRDAAVTDDVLTQAIVELRKAFAEPAKNPRIIETIPRAGYRLNPRIIPAADRSVEPSARAVTAKISGHRARATAFVAACVALALGAVAVWYAVWHSDQAAQAVTTLAVLPFVSLSPDASDAYLAEGIHESIIQRLSEADNLRVIARTSVLQYKNAPKPIVDVAAELHVGAVMEGTVRYDDHRMSITARLYEGSTGRNLWSREYDEDFENVLEIQKDIAARIVDSLRAELSPQERDRLEKPPTQSAAAYASYLKALESPARERLALLGEAIELDPGFALAYVARADVHARRLAATLAGEAVAVANGPWDAAHQERLALSDIDRALTLDPELGRAYAARGMIHLNVGKLDKARSDFERALQLSPNDGRVLEFVSRFKLWTKKFDEAREYLDRVARVDPRNGGVAAALFVAGDLERAYMSLRRSADSDPTNVNYHNVLGLFQALRGHVDEAASELELSEQLLADYRGNVRSSILARIAYAYHRIGRTDDARRVADLVLSSPISLYADRALASLAKGQVDQAYEWMSRISSNVPVLGFMNVLLIQLNLVSDPVLDRPRFRELREHMGPSELARRSGRP